MITSTITLQGNLAVDPNVMENVTELVIITNRRGRDEATGEWVNTDKTRFVVKAFKGLKDKAALLAVGDQLIVAGSIVTDTWADKETGEARYRQVVLADAIGHSL